MDIFVSFFPSTKANVFTAWYWIYIEFFCLCISSHKCLVTQPRIAKASVCFTEGKNLPFTVIWRTVVGNWMWELRALHFEAVSSTLSHSASNDQVLYQYWSRFIFSKRERHFQCWYSITNGSNKENDLRFWVQQTCGSWSVCEVSFEPLLTLYAGLLIIFK